MPHGPRRLAAARPAAWEEAARAAQQAQGRMLGLAIDEGRLDAARFQRWLGMESALGRIGALALERVADWYGTHPHLRATALAWATSLREDALVAAADLRALDGRAAPPPPSLGRWHAFVEAAARSPRAGEALGTVLLHACLLQGDARTATDRVLALPFLAGPGRSWLLRRREPDPPALAQLRGALLEAWPAAALAAGAQRAAAWHREALAHVFETAGPAPPANAPPAAGD